MYLPKKEQFFIYDETTDGVIAVFDEVAELIHAAEETRDKKYYVGFDCFSPFPIHGIDQAMGTPRSGIPWITFVMGLFGGSMGFAYQYLTNVIDWPIVYAGKDYLAWPAFIPVTFEMTIFFAGIFTGLSLFALAKLKPGRKILHKDFTSHKFGLFIPTTAPGYKEADTVNFLKSLGASEVRVVKDNK